MIAFRPVLVLALIAQAVCGGQPAADLAEKLCATRPCPALAATAQLHRIPLEQIDESGQPGLLTPGDSISALVTLHEKGRHTQWLLYLEAANPGPKEQPTNSPAPLIMYSCLGTKLTFASVPAPVKLRTLGPFAAPGRKSPKPGDKSVRFTLDKGFLSLGLDNAAAAILRLKQERTRGSFWFQGKPFSAAEIAENKKKIGAVQLSAHEERALAAAGPALMSYFSVVQQTEGLKDILMEIVDLPSVWSMLRNGGVEANISIQQERLAMGAADAWALREGQTVYHLPILLELNKQPALKITLAVTSPNPPLLACGGVVGLLAERPGDAQTYLSLRIISARRRI
ncbi:MAG: hypothetical protein L0Y58_20785 [Verrucomicrobia subdivision 3 bacterium]|nr:hypothetical protein [Limisphaerales bacterium]